MSNVSPAALSWLRLAVSTGPRTELPALLSAARPQAMRGPICVETAAQLAGVTLDPRRCIVARAWESSLHALEEGHCGLVAACDVEYPETLRQLPDAPPALFTRGDVRMLNAPAVAIVGSRSCTQQGSHDAESFAEALSGMGITVVSGLAAGIDAAAHRGALRAAGSTIAVVGTGPEGVYPRANDKLHAEIVERGCLVTEFPPGSRPLPKHFPRRNRIISGLALGVLVVEAARKSGSLITAHAAANQGRDVFALPGSIHSPHAKGCHDLIREGAKLVDEVQDILDELGWGQYARPAPVRSAATACSPEEGAVLEAIGYASASADQVAVSTGFAIPDVMGHLARLEMARRIEPLPGGRYRRLAVSGPACVIE